MSKKDITIPFPVLILCAPFLLLLWLIMKPIYTVRHWIEGEDEIDDAQKFSLYFYVPKNKKKRARELGDELEKQGYKVNVHFLEGRQGEFDDSWSVTAYGHGDFDENEFETLAKKFSADYDGHEVAAN